MVSNPTISGVQAALRAALDNLSPAAIAFNAPVEMNLEDTAGIELLISQSEEVENLKKKLKQPGTQHGERILVGAQVTATLQAARKGTFEVVPIKPEAQTLRPDKPTRWEWKVTALEMGQQELFLTVSTSPGGSKTAPMSIESYPYRITVNVTPWKRVTRFGKNNWQWLWAPLLVPAVGWLWKRTRRKELRRPE